MLLNCLNLDGEMQLKKSANKSFRMKYACCIGMER